jgi:DNA-binding MarR family transcriptional regulator
MLQLSTTIGAHEGRSWSPSVTVLAMHRTTLTANLKPLERRGLVKGATDPADRRSRRLILTPAGRALLLEAVPI